METSGSRRLQRPLEQMRRIGKGLLMMFKICTYKRVAIIADLSVLDGGTEVNYAI